MKPTPGAPVLDPALHLPARIAIVGRLVVHSALRFAELRTVTGLTAGNLATHLEALERVGYVVRRDAIVRRRPATLVALTPAGRDALGIYLAGLEKLVRDLRALAPAAGLPPEIAQLFPDLAPSKPPRAPRTSPGPA